MINSKQEIIHLSGANISSCNPKARKNAESADPIRINKKGDGFLSKFFIPKHMQTLCPIFKMRAWEFTD